MLFQRLVTRKLLWYDKKIEDNVLISSIDIIEQKQIQKRKKAWDDEKLYAPVRVTPVQASETPMTAKPLKSSATPGGSIHDDHDLQKSSGVPQKITL